MKKIFLVALMISGFVDGADFDFKKILREARSDNVYVEFNSVRLLGEFVDSFIKYPNQTVVNSSTLEILAQEGVDNQVREIQILVFKWLIVLVKLRLINAGNVHYVFDAAMKGISVRRSEIRSLALNLLRDIVGQSLVTQDNLAMVLSSALKGFKDEYGVVQGSALELLIALGNAGLITGDRVELVRKSLIATKCYVQNLRLYQSLLEKLFSEKLSIDELIKKNNITSKEIGIEFNIALKVFNDENALPDKRRGALDTLDLLFGTKVLNEEDVDQVRTAVITGLNSSEPNIQERSTRILWLNWSRFVNTPERIDQIIAACYENVMSHNTDLYTRLLCLMALKNFVDGGFIKTSNADRVIETANAAMQDQNESVRNAALDLRNSLGKKNLIPFTAKEVDVEFNINLKVFNDEKVSSDKRNDALNSLGSLLDTGLLNQEDADQVRTVVIKGLNSSEHNIQERSTRILWLNWSRFVNTPERIDQIIAACYENVMFHNTDLYTRLLCLILLKNFVDGGFIKTSNADRVIETANAAMQDQNESVRNAALELKKLLSEKNLTHSKAKKGMLERSKFNPASAKTLLQHEPFAATKFVYERAGVKPE